MNLTSLEMVRTLIDSGNTERSILLGPLHSMAQYITSSRPVSSKISFPRYSTVDGMVMEWILVPAKALSSILVIPFLSDTSDIFLQFSKALHPIDSTPSSRIKALRLSQFSNAFPPILDFPPNFSVVIPEQDLKALALMLISLNAISPFIPVHSSNAPIPIFFRFLGK